MRHYALVAGVASFGLPSALTAWFTEGSELPLRTHYVIWGALAGVFIPGAALALMRPERSIAAIQQLLGFVIAAAAGLVLAFETESATYIAMFTLPTILLAALHPHRGRLLESGPRMDVPMLALAGVAAIPTGFYALTNLRLSATTHFTDDLHGGTPKPASSPSRCCSQRSWPPAGRAAGKCLPGSAPSVRRCSVSPAYSTRPTPAAQVPRPALPC